MNDAGCTTRAFRRRMRLIFGALMVAAFLVASASTAHAVEVTFADPDLEAAVRLSPLIPDQPTPITDTDMLLLTGLTAQHKAITNLSGLQYATNLTYLDLYDNQVSNLSPLSGLTSLTRLYLDSNQITDVSPLSGLTSLTVLDLRNNQITDVSPLSGLTSLTSLYLGNNQISSIAPLSGLTSLTWLYLYGNPISSVSPLSGLTSLTTLSLAVNQISDVSPLSGLTSLGYLDLGSNQISSVSPLSGLTSLTTLGLYDNQISDISPLVSNAGIDSGDTMLVGQNYLDLTPGSQDMADIQTLVARGVALTYSPQKTPPPGFIPMGTNVSVTVDPVTIVFPTVTAAGTLAVTPYSPRHEGPANFRLLPDFYFDINPTVTFTGMATVTLAVPPSYTGDLSKVKVFHWREPGGWDVITPAVDVGARTLTFQVDHFSDFGLGDPLGGPVVSTPASSWQGIAIAALIGASGLVVHRRRRRVTLA